LSVLLPSAAKAVNPTEQLVITITTAKKKLSNFLLVFFIIISPFLNDFDTAVAEPRAQG
jgi:biopolymer transport protein ExbD